MTDRAVGDAPPTPEAPRHEAMSRLRAAVLLAGTVRPGALRRTADRFLLELPLDAHRSVMDLWHEQLTDTAEHFVLPRIPVRVIVDRSSPVPAGAARGGRCAVTFEQDPSDFRGTGGLLRDLATHYDPDDFLLIANANQVIFEPMRRIAGALAQMNADMALACDHDGTPTGVMLVRCGCLMSIPQIGFVDFNEQALPAIARRHDVRVLRDARLGGVPIRTLGDYLDALRRYHGSTDGQTGGFSDLYAEDWRATFGIIEPGAVVHQSAVVHDSVVLDGGRIEAGGLAVRALVCRGGVVASGMAAVDCLVGPAGPAGGREQD